MRSTRYKKLVSIAMVLAITCSLNGVIASAEEINATNIVSIENAGVASTIPEKYTAKYTSVKDQVKEGVCWSFAGIGAFEGYLEAKGLGDYDLSEEHAKWSASADSEGYGWLLSPDSGAPSKVMPGYLVSGKGPILEVDLPYDVENISNKPSISEDKIKFDVSEIEYITGAEAVKNAIMNYGGVASTYYADQSYSTPDLKSAYCNKVATVNHGIVVIGWDDNYSKDNFNEACRPQNDGAWLIKNSWGTETGDAGLTWISYEDANILTTRSGTVNYAIKTAQKHDVNRKLYQLDECGAVTTFKTQEKFQSVIYANIYDFDNEYKTLSSVIFENTNVGTKYKVYYAPLKDSKIDLENKVELGSGTISFAGYIEVKTNSFSVPSGKGAIMVELQDVSGNTSIGTERDTLVGGQTGYKAKYQTGESYMIANDYQYDLNESSFNYGGNFSIKAVTYKEGIKEPVDDSKDPVNNPTGTPAEDSTEPVNNPTGTPVENPTDTVNDGTEKPEQPEKDNNEVKAGDNNKALGVGFMMMISFALTCLKVKKTKY